MKYLIVVAAAAALASCGGSVEDQARTQCQEQGAQYADQLAAVGVDMDEYCACATEGLTASDAADQQQLAERAQQCISDAMSGQLDS